MGAYSFLYVGEQLLFPDYQSYWPELASLFCDDELSDETPVTAPWYETTCAIVRDRLDSLGFTMEVCRAHIDVEQRRPRPAEENADEDLWLAIEAIRGALDDPAIQLDFPDWSAVLDPRVRLRALLEGVDPNLPVGYNLQEVVGRGYVQADSALCAKAFSEVHVEAVSAPMVVLTEGSTDAEILGGSLRVLLPHLVGYVRFLDYTLKPEGGASALVRAIKAFAAAGVRNHVVAVFDNDAAGAEAMLSLQGIPLPTNFRAVTLPWIATAAAYPTLGPSGASTMDVNGMAGSLELYLGEDVLRKAAGRDLTEVQWTGFMPKIGRYQGELIRKAEVQAAFRHKLRVAATGDTPLGGEWDDMRAALRTVVDAFS